MRGNKYVMIIHFQSFPKNKKQLQVLFFIEFLQDTHFHLYQLKKLHLF